MSRSRRRFVAILTTLGLGLGLGLAAASPAHAATSTNLAFVSTSATVEFGEDWVAQLRLTSSNPSQLFDTQSGSIDVLVDGIAGTYSAGLPIFRGGDAFVTQPDDAPPLGAGVHVITAIFTPSPGTDLVSSQTSVPFQLTVTPIALNAESSIFEVGGDEDSPYVELQTTGPYVDAWGPPAGTWSVSVERGGEEVLTTDVTQLAGAEPQFVALGSVARPGSELLITTEFIPDAAIAAGLTVTQAETIRHAIPALSAAELLVASAQLPWWLVAVLAVLVLGAIAWLVVVLVRRRPKRTVTPTVGLDPSPES